MNLVDAVIAVLLVAAAIHGARRGAAAQLVTFASFLVGLGVGVLLVVTIAAHLHGSTTKTVAAITMLLVPSGVMAALGRRVGERASTQLIARSAVSWLDATAGCAVALAGTLLLCWLFASVLIDSSASYVSSEIEGSSIVRAIGSALPPVPDEFAAVQHYLATTGFPQVLANALPEPVGPVRLATPAQILAVERIADASTVKVLAFGCGNIEQEGSGFVTGAGLVVTNAHVVAGTDRIVVVLSNTQLAATPVLFDPLLDLAVLRTSPLGLPALRLDSGFVERGTPAVVIGYPGGGHLEVGSAGVQSRYVAQGRDIYGTALTTRTVYALRAVVRPGNSGGPLLSAGGDVIGIVFSRSATDPQLGYALASPAVLQELDGLSARAPQAATGACIQSS